MGSTSFFTGSTILVITGGLEGVIAGTLSGTFGIVYLKYGSLYPIFSNCYL